MIYTITIAAMLNKKRTGIIFCLGAVFLCVVWFVYAKDVPIHVLKIETQEIPSIIAHKHPEGDPDFSHSTWHVSGLVLVPEDIWVTSIQANVLNAPLGILHHVLLYEVGVRNPICPKTFRNVREWYAASMNTSREPVIFPAPHGVFFKKGTPLAIEAMEHTAEVPHGPGGAYRNVVIEMILEYVKASESTDRNRPLEFYRLRLDDSPCSYPMRHEAFTVPAGMESYVKTVKEDAHDDGGMYMFTKNGEIIAFGSNFWPWKGGEIMRARINGAVVSEIRAEKLEESWAWRIPQDAGTRIPVHARDVITAEMTYSNPYKTKDIKDASGMLGFYFSPVFDSDE